MKTLTILTAITGALLCAQMPAADNGKIVVYYTAPNPNLPGPRLVSYIYLDQYQGPQGVALHANRYYEFIVAPGAHRLIRHGALGSQDAIQIQVASGETVYVESHPGWNWYFEVSEDQAHAKLRVSQLKPQN
jgi:hypothetical protein